MNETVIAPQTLAFLVLHAGEFELALAIEDVLHVYEFEPSRVRPAVPEECARLGAVMIDEERVLELIHLGALLSKDTRPALPKGTFDAVEVPTPGGSALLLVDELGSIEEYTADEGTRTPSLLWGGDRSRFPVAWPGPARLRWQIEPLSMLAGRKPPVE